MQIMQLICFLLKIHIFHSNIRKKSCRFILVLILHNYSPRQKLSAYVIEDDKKSFKVKPPPIKKYEGQNT